MKTVIHWFRQDLRLSDNPSLIAAAKALIAQDAVAQKLLPIFILDDESAGVDARGAASRVFLHHALQALDQCLDGRLRVYKGRAVGVLRKICREENVQAVYWNRAYEGWRIERDIKIKSELNAMGVEAQSFNGSLLWEPWEVKKADGTPYRVFTPFYRKGCLSAAPPRTPIEAPKLELLDRPKDALRVEDLGLLPSAPRWDEPMMAHWQATEAGAHKALERFLETGISHYKEGRNFPAKPYVSRLSPHLHFGTLSPNQAWYAAGGGDENHAHFRSELGWREFSHSLLYHFPELPRENWNAKFNAFPWTVSHAHLEAWQNGRTGVPFVDAGMRELWQTGSMHNRVRMVVASFLIKNLRIDWREGYAWFWDTLVDADLANNAASWQWVAGSGADAAPYFRIFNPVTQGQKFDPDGDYVRQYVPELGMLPNRYLHAPWEAPQAVLQEAGLVLGESYPYPIVDLKRSREEALQAYQDLPK